MLASHQTRIDGVHRAARALGVAGARQHRPALRDRIDLAFGIALPSRAACRRRSTRGGTSRRPTRFARCARQLRGLVLAAAANAVSPRIGARSARTAAARGTGTMRATRFRPCRACRPDSCRRSSRRSRSAAGHARRTEGHAGLRERSADTRWRSGRTAPAGRSTSRLPC